MRGPVSTQGAAEVSLRDSTLSGPVSVTDSTGAVTLNGMTVNGSLTCSGNAIVPTGEGNAVRGPATGQCAGMG